MSLSNMFFVMGHVLMLISHVCLFTYANEISLPIQVRLRELSLDAVNMLERKKLV